MKTQPRTQSTQTLVEPKTTVLPSQRSHQRTDQPKPRQHRGAIATGIVSVVAAAAGVVMLWSGVFDGTEPKAATQVEPVVGTGYIPGVTYGPDQHLYNEAARLRGEQLVRENLAYGSDRHLYNLAPTFAIDGSDQRFYNQLDRIRAEQRAAVESASGSDQRLYNLAGASTGSSSRSDIDQLRDENRMAWEFRAQQHRTTPDDTSGTTPQQRAELAHFGR